MTPETPTPPTEITPEKQAQLEARDDRVRASIRFVVAGEKKLQRDLWAQMRELREEIAGSERLVHRIKEAVRKGEFHQLEGIVEQSDIESLCGDWHPATPGDRIETYLE